MRTTDQHITDVRERIAVAGGAAILVAGLLLVTVVLPAEYGVDPVGTGARLGLIELGAIGQQVAALDAAAATSVTRSHRSRRTQRPTAPSCRS